MGETIRKKDETKLLIIDKSIFQKTELSNLVKFVECYNVVLPYTLCVECTVSQKGNPPREAKDPIKLMNRHLEVVKNGAYAGKSPAKIVEEEKSRNAAIDSLIDMEQTQIMREAILDEKPDLEEARRTCDKAFKPIKDIVEQWLDKYYKNIVKKKLEKDFREDVDKGDLVGRLKMWLQAVDKMKIDILNTFSGNRTDEMSDDRWEWQMLRLSLAWGTELASKRNKSGPCFENNDISNDIFDIYYVSHLLHADGLITDDNDQMQLAMAAFPNKDLFGSIDNVTDEYCKRK